MYYLQWQLVVIEPPFSQSKVYHSEVKPDASTLKLEVTRHWKAYMKSGRQPRPSNWKIDKCIKYLMEVVRKLNCSIVQTFVAWTTAQIE